MVQVKVLRLVYILLLIGTLIQMLTMIYDLRSMRLNANSTNSGVPVQTHHADPTLMIDDSAALILKSRARILCWVPSTPKQLNVKVKAINSTWLQRCDGHIFFIEGLNPKPWDVVNLDVPKGYYNLTTKVVTVLLYLYRYHLNQYDWFLKADDDAYVVMENLRYVLAQYHPHKPVYVGHMYKPFHPQGYMSGGATYALSRGALRRVVEEGYQKHKCNTKGSFEDVEVGKCLHAAGVESHNSRDRFGRDTFHPLTPSTHIVGPIPANQKHQDFYTMVSGNECCSQLTVSFHKLDPNLMRIFDHLLYRISVYGRVLDVPALEGLVKPGVIAPRKG